MELKHKTRAFIKRDAWQIALFLACIIYVSSFYSSRQVLAPPFEQLYDFETPSFMQTYTIEEFNLLVEGAYDPQAIHRLITSKELYVFNKKVESSQYDNYKYLAWACLLISSLLLIMRIPSYRQRVLASVCITIFVIGMIRTDSRDLPDEMLIQYNATLNQNAAINRLGEKLDALEKRISILDR